MKRVKMVQDYLLRDRWRTEWGQSFSAIMKPRYSITFRNVLERPLTMGRVSTLPKRLQPMLATLTDAPFDDKKWVFEDKFDGFRMVAKIQGGKVALYSRNGKIY